MQPDKSKDINYPNVRTLIMSLFQIGRYIPYAGLMLLGYPVFRLIKTFYGEKQIPILSRYPPQNLLERILGDDILLEKIMPGREPIEIEPGIIVTIAARSAYRPQPN